MRKPLDDLLLATTDVGSMPLQDDFDAGRTNFDRAIVDKVMVGLNFPCYPQLAGTRSKPMNMGLQFLIPLSKTNPNIQVKGEEVQLVSGEIREPSNSMGVERAEHYATYLREHDLIDRVRGIKACVTGPFTLASYLNSDNLLTCGASKPEVVRALANVLSRSCRRLGDLGFDWINIDEPFLSLMLGREHELMYEYDEHFVVEMLNMLIGEMPCLSGIHVCGTVTPMVKTVLLESKADIVDHEFAATPKNLQAYTKDDLEQTGKFLAYGCISSIKPSIETVEEISASVRKALDRFGPRVILKPDCGFGGMQNVPEAYATVLGKLRNLVTASRKLAAI